MKRSEGWDGPRLEGVGCGGPGRGEGTGRGGQPGPAAGLLLLGSWVPPQAALCSLEGMSRCHLPPLDIFAGSRQAMRPLSEGSVLCHLNPPALLPHCLSQQSAFNASEVPLEARHRTPNRGQGAIGSQVTNSSGLPTACPSFRTKGTPLTLGTSRGRSPSFGERVGFRKMDSEMRRTR